MTTARFFFGASLWALLVVDMCCGPVQRGFNPGASSSVYPRSGASQGMPSSQYSPGVMPEGQSQRAKEDPAGPAKSGAGFQSGSEESKWLFAPPIVDYEETSPPLYQAGELSQFERSIDAGDYDYETVEEGPLPPPYYGPEYDHTPLDENLEGYTSPPLPDGRWIAYPYYDYRFLTGQYPTGTVSYFSGSSDQGSDNYEEVHYVRDFPAPPQPINSPMAKTPEVPKQPFYSGRPAKQPIRQAGGYGSQSSAVKHV
ncbi:uncharacterized protein LOC128446197 isoform X1 [Pleuronectes platessa]|uniref:uncharacterized protein LOC128446197 isoform X1 n=1 Tax=Pleuronectes platessa TaxID=8262 RepID=UPI00232A59E7|nr:uncharacterized protein LOC128446197 isoform X1 [Pleuronectes platessa]XP_053285160.1 uncharacterized protein LOC128446197 isoform X1 [Pleuronectes platessa]